MKSSCSMDQVQNTAQCQFGHNMGVEWWEHVASIVYTISWSVCLYGLVYENYKLKSVEGCEFNFLVMNLTGYVLYSIYCTLGYFFDESGAGTVIPGDVFFAYHGIFMTCVICCQVAIYPRGRNRVSGYTVILCTFLWVCVIGQILLAKFLKLITETQLWSPVTVIGYGKLLVSIVKYSPPVYWNYKRKSTKGWSIFRNLADFVGGVTSLTSGILSASKGFNITKISLAILTIFYDVIFIFQHYVLYPSPSHREDSSGQVKLIASGLNLQQENDER